MRPGVGRLVDGQQDQRSWKSTERNPIALAESEGVSIALTGSEAGRETAPMSSRIMNTSFDCADPYSLALFWSKALDRPMDPADLPGTDEAGFEVDSGQNVLFLKVPEPKVVKNRLHLCLEPQQPRDAEVDRLLALGAAMHDDQRTGDGAGWAVLNDPEGNEFCVLLSAEERAQRSTGTPPPTERQ